MNGPQEDPGLMSGQIDGAVWRPLAPADAQVKPLPLGLVDSLGPPAPLPTQPEGLFCTASLPVFLPPGPHLRADFNASHSLLLYRIEAKLSLGATPYSKIPFLLLIF